MTRRVVVTGIGMVTPLGATTDETWNALLEGKSGIQAFPKWKEDLPQLTVTIAGTAPVPDPKGLVPPEDEDTVDKLTLFAISAADQAMTMAGLDKISEDEATRAGCVIGAGLAGYTFVLQNLLAYNEADSDVVSPRVIDALSSNTIPAHLCRRFNLKGPSYVTVSACTSGAHGIGEAFQHIAHGRADVMVSGGTEGAVNELTIAGFAAMRALSATHNDEPEKASRPFEKTRDGFVLGEGCGVLVLEEYEHAKARGAKILAEIVGYGATGDAHHITAPAEEGEGAQRAMRGALEMAGMSPDDVDYINAHGTSTPLNDVNEAIAIQRVFGDRATNGLLVSSTKSMTGHLLGGAGGIEAVISVLALLHQKVPPTINHDEADPDIHIDVVPEGPRDARVRAALSNAFGFGGTNGSLLFREAPSA